MILLQHVIEGVTTPVTIAPLGDIQWNGDRSEVAYDHLVEHVKRATLRNALFVGTGDYIDFVSPSNRDTLRTGKLYDNARKTISRSADQLVDECVKDILAPTVGRWLGLVSGHHYFRRENGTTSDHYLVEKLKAPYLGEDTAVVRLTFKEKTHTQHVDIWVAHGRGNGQLPASPIAILDKVSHWFDADIYLMGHQTKKCVADANRIVPIFPARGPARLDHKTLHLVGAGGWSKGYIAGTESGAYPEKGLMRPVTLGAPIIRIEPRWRRSQAAGGASVWEPGITVEA